MEEGNKDIVLSIRGMSKSFGRNKVLKHIDHGCAERLDHGSDG